MSLRKSLELFVGSCVVYFAVVACGSSSGGEKPAAETGGTNSTGGVSQGGTASGGSDAGFGFGGIPDPTPDAGAAEAGDGPGPGMCDCPEPPDPYVPPEPLVVEAECDVEIGNTMSGQLYAVIDRPDLPEEKIVQGVPVYVYAADQAGRPAGHRTIAGSGISLSSNEVAVGCGTYGTGAATPPTTVRFVFPR